MVERFLSQTSFSSQEDFIKNLKINVPENFNFGYDVVDAWAAEQPDKNALLWTKHGMIVPTGPLVSVPQLIRRMASQGIPLSPFSYDL